MDSSLTTVNKTEQDNTLNINKTEQDNTLKIL